MRKLFWAFCALLVAFAAWADGPVDTGGSADNLGNHTATQDVDMQENQLTWTAPDPEGADGIRELLHLPVRHGPDKTCDSGDREGWVCADDSECPNGDGAPECIDVPLLTTTWITNGVAGGIANDMMNPVLYGMGSFNLQSINSLTKINPTEPSFKTRFEQAFLTNATARTSGYQGRAVRWLEWHVSGTPPDAEELPGGNQDFRWWSCVFPMSGGRWGIGGGSCGLRAGRDWFGETMLAWQAGAVGAGDGMSVAGMPNRSGSAKLDIQNLGLYPWRQSDYQIPVWTTLKIRDQPGDMRRHYNVTEWITSDIGMSARTWANNYGACDSSASGNASEADQCMVNADCNLTCVGGTEDGNLCTPGSAGNPCQAGGGVCGDQSGAGKCIKDGGICLSGGGSPTGSSCSDIAGDTDCGGGEDCVDTQRYYTAGVTYRGQVVALGFGDLLASTSTHRTVGWCNGDHGVQCLDANDCTNEGTTGPCNKVDEGRIVRSANMVSAEIDTSSASSLTVPNTPNDWDGQGRNFGDVTYYRVRQNYSGDNVKGKNMTAFHVESPSGGLGTGSSLNSQRGIRIDNQGMFASNGFSIAVETQVDSRAAIQLENEGAIGNVVLEGFMDHKGGHFGFGCNPDGPGGSTCTHLFGDDTNNVLRIKHDAAGEGTGAFAPKGPTDGQPIAQHAGMGSCNGSASLTCRTDGDCNSNGSTFGPCNFDPQSGLMALALDGTSCDTACPATGADACRAAWEKDGADTGTTCGDTTGDRECMCS